MTWEWLPLSNVQFIRKASIAVSEMAISTVQIAHGAEFQHAVRIFVEHSLDAVYQFDIICSCTSSPSKCFASSGRNIQGRKSFYASGTQLWSTLNSGTSTMFVSFSTPSITCRPIQSLMWVETTIAWSLSSDTSSRRCLCIRLWRIGNTITGTSSIGKAKSNHARSTHSV